MSVRKWYIPLFILLIVAFTPWLKEIKRANKLSEEARIENAPHYSPEKARSEHDWVIRTETEWTRLKSIPGTEHSYWEYLERRVMLEDALYRLSATLENPARLEFGSRLTEMETHSATNQIRTLFDMKFQEFRMMKNKPKGAYFDRSAPQIDSHGLEKFGEGYLWSIPVMFLVFMIRLRVRDLMILPEIWRLIPASIFWPIGLFVYPGDIRRKDQLKTALHFIAQLASATLALAGGPLVQVIKAQTTKPNKGGVEKNDKKSGSNVFSYGIELYPQTSGIDSGTMASPWLYASLKGPKGFSFSSFSFIEATRNRSQLFTNHTENISHEKSRGAMFSTEIGWAPSGAFFQIGPRFNLTKIPGFPKRGNGVVKSVVAGSFWRVRGPTHYQEFFLGWASQEARLPLGFRLSTEGFMRFRPGPRPAVGQPQVLLRHPKIPYTQLVAEFWMIGTQPTTRLGLQFSK